MRGGEESKGRSKRRVRGGGEKRKMGEKEE